MTALHWLAFGDLDAGVWGMAWVPDDAAGHAALGAGADLGVLEAELEAGDERWRLSGEGLELSVSGGEVDGLARAVGTITLGASERAIDSPGWRGVVADLPDTRELDSLRLLAAWFDDDEGLALLALRPRKARGQESDVVTAVLIDAGEPRAVSDPRLSTTYDGEGVPARAGLELWVTEPSEDPGSAGERPHRVAGEAAGAPAGWTEGNLAIGAQPFRWHCRDRDGDGVYLLGRS